MTVFTRAALAIVLALALPAAAAAQPEEISMRGTHFSEPAVRIGEDYVLNAGDFAREALVIAGDATIEGTVDRDVVVVLGKVQVAGTADVRGSMVVVGGTAAVAEGARIQNDLFVVGGYEGARGFSPEGHQIVIGTAALGSRLRGIVPWITRGLLFGRPIVPDLYWVWVIAGVFFLVNLLLNVVFHAPVRASAIALRATPVSAFVTGLLVMLLAAPVCALLAVSVIGIAVIPFLLCALLLGAILGKIAFARWIGMTAVHQDDLDDKMLSLRSFLIGSAIMCLAYMIPILGLVTWSMAGVFGLGASMLAFSSAYRRENPKKPKPPRVARREEPPPAAVPLTEAPAMAADVPLNGVSDGAMREAPLATLVEEPRAFADQPLPAGTRPPLVTLPRAAFLDRLGAFVLDFILVVIVAQVLDVDRHVDAPLGRVGILLAIAYHVGFWTWKGTTLGGVICNLRVVRTDGAALQFAEALVRGLTGVFSLAVAGLGFLWILRDPERQAWHDRVAGTYVVKVPRAWPL